MSTVDGTNSSEHLYATDSADIVRGYGGNDTLEAYGGDDILTGGTGDDYLYGQGGDDWLLGAGTNGDGIGNDVIDGGSGYDTVTYSYAKSGVTVSLDQGKASGGNDVGTDKLYGLDNIYGSGFGDKLQGNYWTVFSGHGENEIHGGGGGDLIEGLSGNDQLYGDAGKDIVNGGDDQDLIVGGADYDVLFGGSGSDTFVFGGTVSNPDSGIGLYTRDIILDFVHGVDKMNVSSIDANTGVAGDQQFVYLGGSQTDAPGTITATWEGNSTVLHFHVDQNYGDDFQIELSGRLTPSASDFVL